MRTFLIVIAAAAGLGLAGCGERSTGGKTPRKADAKVWQGTDNAYTASGWKASDEAAWNEQMRSRAQSQNEYNRVR